MKLSLCMAFPIVIFLGGSQALTRVSGRANARVKPLGERWYGYNERDVKEYLDALGEGGRVTETRYLALDLLFPFLYGGSLAASLIWLWTMNGRAFSPVFTITPVAVAMISDWTENVLQLHELSKYAKHTPAGLSSVCIGFASAATITKLAFTGISSLLVLALVIVQAELALTARSAP
jgi:hypothetical protein